MKTQGILICAMGVMMLAGCSKDTTPVNSENTEKVETIAINEIIEKNDSVEKIMSLTMYPSGEIVESQEQFDEMTETYIVYSDGIVENKNGDMIELSENDLNDIHKFYNDFCAGDVTTTEDLIMDAPSYELTVYNNGEELEYVWDATKQVEEVMEVCEMINACFYEYSIENQ